MRRRQFEAYLKKVFNFPVLVAQVPEGRRCPQHPCHKVFEALLLGAAMQLPSMHQLEQECRDGALRTRIGPISEDTFRYALQRLAPETIFAVGCQIAKRLKRNGLLRAGWARGRVVAAIDGIELCASFVRCCDACLERQVKRKIDDVWVEVTQYYHRLVAVAVVSTPFPVVLGIRFQAPGEGEEPCAMALLRTLVEQLGRRFIDVLVGDALYLATPFVEVCEDLDLEWVFTVKENQPDLLEDIEMHTRGLPTAQQLDPDRQWHLWDLPEVYWACADRTVHVVRTECTEMIQHRTVQSQDGHRRTVRTPSWEHSLNIYATNLALCNLSPTFIEQLGRSRWRIDTEVFKTLTVSCHFKRPSVHTNHDQALVNLTMIRVLAYLLTQVFFHRQVLSHYRRHRPSYRDLGHQLAADSSATWDDSS